ncbi:MetQ/NlpA family ABC transporter substrate-binding protein [Dictyobacter formicarum]|uniref:Lipoprotein n=1 Tax=Dictyobacter formicarum TaxID=2778368 RepID=A0ABQ3VDF4_9CHLR|nr:MetQ/NlpA family ABC transporter substrate-binding protein [Dictyobacter formicarum]GHO83794.1 lipoprotein [Dictyobacter formicarum]
MRSLKFNLVILCALMATVFAACGGSSTSSSNGNGPITIKVGAAPTPHAEILRYINDNLAAKAGLNIQVVEFTDYVQPNLALQDGQIDANFFQHIPYMEDFNQQHGMNMVAVTKVHIEPLGIYSHKVKSLNEVASGSVVAIPNDVTNGGRALQLLADHGLIKLRNGAGTSATTHDIVSNPKNLQIKELEAAQLPRSLDDTTLSVINGNYALSVGLTPAKDALALEKGQGNPYANVLTVLKGHENDPGVTKLAKLLNSPEVKKFIEDKYKGSVIPAF